MKSRNFQSYPSGSAVAGGLPSHLMPSVAVDADWIAMYGSRAQRRRVKRELMRQAAKSRRQQDGTA
jgi:hypothetical protein